MKMDIVGNGWGLGLAEQGANRSADRKLETETGAQVKNAETAIYVLGARGEGREARAGWWRSSLVGWKGFRYRAKIGKKRG